ncbi:MAG: hypothetical protein H6712_34340 [Myxococcales bacterium]|nr:hypothetical protein [Myxococcales bacterium]MCB9718975.1 hypothetical protein [Myxococcales bacterium]
MARPHAALHRPATGDYAFDTFGSGYDTVLALHDDCVAGSELVCNDDSGGPLQSAVTTSVVAGQQVVIAVSGLSGATGAWQLDVTQRPSRLDRAARSPPSNGGEPPFRGHRGAHGPPTEDPRWVHPYPG